MSGIGLQPEGVPGTECSPVKEPPPEKLRLLLRQQFAPEQWAGMKRQEKCSVKVAGCGLIAIARRFGIAGSPANNHDIHLALGRAIWGDRQALRGRTTADLRSAITGQFTPERWGRMTQKEKRALRINGLGLAAISSRFGIEGTPVGYHSIHLMLGRAIWGNHPAVQGREATDFLPLLRKRFTASQWAELTTREKYRLKVSGRGLKAIARAFSIAGDPVGRHADHLVLGRAIWGNHPAFGGLMV
jgi:hypothetical protein